MEAITGVSSVSAKFEATVAILQQSLDSQAQLMQQLLASLGIGRNFNASA